MVVFSKNTARLYTGAEIPMVGLGTWKGSEKMETVKVVKAALDAGYRHIDCASLYMNEKEVGKGIRASGINREDIFVTSKLWTSHMHPDIVEKALDLSLANLGLEYLDLYLIHWPYPQPFEGLVLTSGAGEEHPSGEQFHLESLNALGFNEDGTVKGETGYKTTDTWKALEKMVTKGKVKHIGLSNFNQKEIRKILDVATINPAVLQVELHPYLPQNDLVSYCKDHNIHVTAYSPLGSYGEPRVMEDSTLKLIAERNNVTSAQVMLAWAKQRGTSVVPKSSSVERLKSNIQDFVLSQKDMDAISNIETRHRFFNLFSTFD